MKNNLDFRILDIWQRRGAICRALFKSGLCPPKSKRSLLFSMSDPIITVENLSKRYIIGHNRRGDGLRHAMERAAQIPWDG